MLSPTAVVTIMNELTRRLRNCFTLMRFLTLPGIKPAATRLQYKGIDHWAAAASYIPYFGLKKSTTTTKYNNVRLDEFIMVKNLRYYNPLSIPIISKFTDCFLKWTITITFVHHFNLYKNCHISEQFLYCKFILLIIYFSISIFV